MSTIIGGLVRKSQKRSIQKRGKTIRRKSLRRQSRSPRRSRSPKRKYLRKSTRRVSIRRRNVFEGKRQSSPRKQLHKLPIKSTLPTVTNLPIVENILPTVTNLPIVENVIRKETKSKNSQNVLDSVVYKSFDKSSYKLYYAYEYKSAAEVILHVYYNNIPIDYLGNTQYYRIYIAGLNARDSSGIVRKMLCRILHKILNENPTISLKDNIMLWACGDGPTGKYIDLVNLYKRMGFKVAQIVNNENENCSTRLLQPIDGLLKWCANYDK